VTATRSPQLRTDPATLLHGHAELRARLPELRSLADHAGVTRPVGARRRLARRAARFLAHEVLPVAAHEDATLDRWPSLATAGHVEHLRRQHDAVRLIASSIEDVAAGSEGPTVDLEGLLRAALDLLTAHLDVEARLLGDGAGEVATRREPPVTSIPTTPRWQRPPTPNGATP
jgi:hypothetical protein